MIKTFYIQKNEESVITDIIEFPHEDYVEAQINTPLPPKIMSGCYKLLNGELIYIPNLDEDELVNKISILEAEKEALKQINSEQDNLIVDNAYKIAMLELGGM